MSGSSIERSRTSARAATAASTSAAVVASASKPSRCRRPVRLAAEVRGAGDAEEVGRRLHQVDHEHPLGADGRGQTGQRAVVREPAVVDDQHPFA